MDPKTKVLLHTAGATIASDNHLLDATEFTAYPPAYTFSVANQMLNHPSYAGDKKHVIASVAHMIGKSVGKAVEDQILKGYEMDSAQALGIILDAKKKAFEDHFVMPGQILNPLTDADPVMSQTSLPDPNVDILANIKKAMEVIDNHQSHGGILSVADHDMLWSHHPVAWHGAQHGHIVAYDPAVKPPPDENLSECVRFPETAIFHDLIPGFAKMRQPCPQEGCAHHKRKRMFLQSTIIHLNDRHKWTREKIAEWLETLDHDLTFRTPDEVKNNVWEEPVVQTQAHTPEDVGSMTLGEYQGALDAHIGELLKHPLVVDKALFGITDAGEGVNNGDTD